MNHNSNRISVNPIINVCYDLIFQENEEKATFDEVAH